MTLSACRRPNKEEFNIRRASRAVNETLGTTRYSRMLPNCRPSILMSIGTGSTDRPLSLLPLTSG